MILCPPDEWASALVGEGRQHACQRLRVGGRVWWQLHSELTLPRGSAASSCLPVSLAKGGSVRLVSIAGWQRLTHHSSGRRQTLERQRSAPRRPTPCPAGWTGSRQYLRFMRQHVKDMGMFLSSHRWERTGGRRRWCLVQQSTGFPCSRAAMWGAPTTLLAPALLTLQLLFTPGQVDAKGGRRVADRTRAGAAAGQSRPGTLAAGLGPYAACAHRGRSV